MSYNHRKIGYRLKQYTWYHHVLSKPLRRYYFLTVWRCIPVFFIFFTFFRIFWNGNSSTNLSLFLLDFGGCDGLVCFGWGCELFVGALPGLKHSLVVSFSSMKCFARPFCRPGDRSNDSTGVGPLPVLIHRSYDFPTWLPDELNQWCRNRPHLLEMYWSR